MSEPTAETQALLHSLRQVREHVIEVCEELSEDEQATPRLPSGWSPRGLIRHLALDIEHYWFQCVVSGLAFGELPDGVQGDDGWQVQPGESGAELIALYRRCIERSDRVITSRALDSEPDQHDPRWGDWSLPTLRRVVLHVITETACHAGHLDAVAELVDGRQSVVLT